MVKQSLLSINWSLPYKVLEILHLWTVNIVQLLMFWSKKKKSEANVTQNAQANYAKRRPDGWQKLQGRKEIRLFKLSSLPFWQAVTCVRIYKPYTHFHQPRKTFSIATTTISLTNAKKKKKNYWLTSPTSKWQIQYMLNPIFCFILFFNTCLIVLHFNCQFLSYEIHVCL